MGQAITYFVIYIAEAFIAWQYFSSIFWSKFRKHLTLLNITIGYCILFLISFKEIYWLNTICFFIMNLFCLQILFKTNIKKALLSARVKGRIEMVKVSDEFTLLIDYAHNAMALESLLAPLKEYEPGRLVCLFGCGGNRAKSRRYEMGEVSGKLADLTIITSDNPRFEEPQDIIEDIKTGISKTNGAYVEICDRKEAIKYAIENGQPGDIVVLAGKGHEDYQEIKGVKYPMDERDLIRDILAGK